MHRLLVPTPLKDVVCGFFPDMGTVCILHNKELFFLKFSSSFGARAIMVTILSKMPHESASELLGRELFGLRIHLHQAHLAPLSEPSKSLENRVE